MVIQGLKLVLEQGLSHGETEIILELIRQLSMTTKQLSDCLNKSENNITRTLLTLRLKKLIRSRNKRKTSTDRLIFEVTEVVSDLNKEMS